MIKRISLLVMTVFLAYPLFAADLTTQSVGLSIDKRSPNYNIDLILKKVILSVAASNQNVRMYSSDKQDLEFTGIKELNGDVLMKAVKKGGAYQVELYDAGETGKKPVLFDDTVRLTLKEFGDTVDDTALKIINIIAKKFPQKPAAQLTKINLVKIKLSEYESQDGYWSLTVMPAFSLLDIDASIRKVSGSSFGKMFKGKGGSLYVEGIYRYQQWTFGAGASASIGGWTEDNMHASFNDYYAHVMFGYGLFGSLIIVGFQPEFYYLNYNTDYTNFNTYYSNTLIAPNIRFRHLQLFFFLQINISKDYYITFLSGPPIPGDIFNGMNLDFNKNGQYSSYSNVNVPGDWINGGFYIRLILNFRLFSSWWLRFNYDTLTPSFSRYNNNQNNTLIITTDGQFQLENLNINKTRIGLGIQYDF